MPVKKGDKVKVDYTGTLDDGTVFDSSEKHGKQLEFEVGSRQVIPGFDDALIGMEKGEEKDVHIPCAQAYGDPNPGLVKQLPRDKLPADQEPKPGLFIGIHTPDGKTIPARITKVEDKELTIDINHPLAGKDLNFKIKLIEIL